MGKIITAHDVLCKLGTLTDEDREKIRHNIEKLFAEALAFAQKIIAAVEKEVENEVRGGRK